MPNPHIQSAVDSLRNEVESLETTIANSQRQLALKREALLAMESLKLHTPPASEAISPPAKAV